MGSLMQKGHRIRIARHRGWLFQSDSAIDAGADAQDDRVGALSRMPGLGVFSRRHRRQAGG